MTPREPLDAILEPQQTEIRETLWKMDLCPCGSFGKYSVVKDMLERADQKGSFYEAMEPHLSGYAVEFIAAVMNSWDLLEHGGGVGGSWLTDKGELLLHFFRRYGDDDRKWPRWATDEGVFPR